jgi:hypothetical protein
LYQNMLIVQNKTVVKKINPKNGLLPKNN